MKLIETYQFTDSKYGETRKKELLSMYKDINYMKDKENEGETIEFFNSTAKRIKGYKEVLTKGIRLVNELFKDKIKIK